MEGQVPGPAKKERSEALRELGQRKELAHRKRFLSCSLDVVVESAPERPGEALCGLTDNYLRVLLPEAGHECAGRRIAAEMIGLGRRTLVGRFTAFS